MKPVQNIVVGLKILLFINKTIFKLNDCLSKKFVFYYHFWQKLTTLCNTDNQYPKACFRKHKAICSISPSSDNKLQKKEFNLLLCCWFTYQACNKTRMGIHSSQIPVLCISRSQYHSITLFPFVHMLFWWQLRLEANLGKTTISL